jgi:hypothetical protein
LQIPDTDAMMPGRHVRTRKILREQASASHVLSRFPKSFPVPRTRRSKNAVRKRFAAAPPTLVDERGFAARGRYFTTRQVLMIERVVEKYASQGRTSISRRVCRALRWRQRNGALKDMACREVLRRLDAKGLIDLAAPKWGGAVWSSAVPPWLDEVETGPLRELNFSAIRFERVRSKSDPVARLWNWLVTQYHYLHSSRLVGRQLSPASLGTGMCGRLG